jgi:molybdate transport system permease protein
LAAATLGAAFLALPLAGLLARAPWSSLGPALAAPAARTALRLSLQCSLGAVAISVAVGVPLAWVLARTTLPGRSLLRALVTVPLVLPPVVGGVALLTAFGRNGILGGVVRGVGFSPFSTLGATLAGAFVALPFLVLAVEGAMAGLDRRHEDVAATLGAGPLRVFLRVTVPLVAPAVASGATLAWARALGEFGATVTFAGSLPGRTQTLPLEVYLALQTDPQAAVAESVLLLAVAVAVLLALRARWRLR